MAPKGPSVAEKMAIVVLELNHPEQELRVGGRN